MEWRWENDRENFEKEIKEEQFKEEKPIKQQKPKKMMDDINFWSLIARLNFKYTDIEEDILEPAVNYLSKLTVNEIKQFEEALSYKLHLLDTKEHAKYIGKYSYNEKNHDNFSPDLFLYIRCRVIASGEEFYELTLNNPKNMQKVIRLKHCYH